MISRKALTDKLMEEVTANQHLARPVLWIRIRMDPHNFGNLEPHPDPHQIKIQTRICIRIRIKVISWIRIRIILQMTSQNVWNMSLF
jgi:hypothetical protein